ncbi:MAG: hypothetical protein R2699_02675 [Acidimicrobiales bacterium]
MFGYATDLRSKTRGATYTMQFDSYQQMPASVQEEIVTRISSGEPVRDPGVLPAPPRLGHPLFPDLPMQLVSNERPKENPDGT